MSQPFALVGAMDEEIEVFKSFIKDIKSENWHEFVFYRGQLWGREVVLVKTGIGKVFSALVTQHLIDTYQPEKLIFSGVAGALNPNYQIGDVVVARDTIQHDLDARDFGYERGQVPGSSYKEFICDQDLIDGALSAKLAQGKIHLGRILSGDQFISQSHRPEFKYLKDELDGDVVEMEGAAVGQVCVINQIPFLIIRTVSDKADGESPQDFKAFLPLVAANSQVVIKRIFDIATL